MANTQRSKDDTRPAKLTAVETFDIKYLMMINEVALELLKEKHPQAIKLANAIKAINFTHDARQEITEAMTAKADKAVSVQKATASKTAIRNAEIYDASKFIEKKSGWAVRLGKRFELSPKAIQNIVSRMKKAEVN